MAEHAVSPQLLQQLAYELEGKQSVGCGASVHVVSLSVVVGSPSMPKARDGVKPVAAGGVL